jgi:hypothetical protein
MDMIWHDHEHVDLDGWEMIGDGEPTLPHDFSEWRETDPSVSYAAKDTAPVERTYRDEIGSGLRVIEISETDRPPVEESHVTYPVN